MIPGSDYRQSVVTLKPSDFLVLYTDGITDAENGTAVVMDVRSRAFSSDLVGVIRELAERGLSPPGRRQHANLRE